MEWNCRDTAPPPHQMQPSLRRRVMAAASPNVSADRAGRSLTVVRLSAIPCTLPVARTAQLTMWALGDLLLYYHKHIDPIRFVILWVTLILLIFLYSRSERRKNGFEHFRWVDQKTWSIFPQRGMFGMFGDGDSQPHFAPKIYFLHLQWHDTSIKMLIVPVSEKIGACSLLLTQSQAIK